ncbi:MAG: SDR family oxidoreductase [Acidimicrobiia bacterium]
MSERDFLDTTSIVTGGTRGIGRAIALELARRGSNLVIVARKADELALITQELAQFNVGVLTVCGSMGDLDFVRTISEQVVAHFGRIDVVINNAATNPPGAFGPIVETEAGAVRKLLEVNLEGPLELIRGAWSASMKEHGGAIVNVASVGGIQPAPFLGAYNVSKAALIYLTRQLAGEVAPHVRVNAIAPGLVKTDFASALFAAGDDAANALHPLGRYGTPEEVAKIAVFLASDAANWVTGQTWVIDGGISVRQS